MLVTCAYYAFKVNLNYAPKINDGKINIPKMIKEQILQCHTEKGTIQYCIIAESET